MKITVAICTWNRSRLLRQTLQSLEQIRLGEPHEWELLIVDNASTDDTKDVIESFRNTLPLRYLSQPILGHTRSRNHAIEKATGELIVWTDDDVLVERDWLGAYAVAANKYPQSTFFGGAIVPRFETGMPTWLRETWSKCSSAFATREQGDGEIPIPPALFPFGANFAVRANAQKEFLFDVDLGAKPVECWGKTKSISFAEWLQPATQVFGCPRPNSNTSFLVTGRPPVTSVATLSARVLRM